MCAAIHDLRSRRGAFSIIYEILLAYDRGWSKTRAVEETNLNFLLMDKFLGFLFAHGYFEPMATVPPTKVSLSARGKSLLASLAQLMVLEGELDTLRIQSRHDGLKPQTEDEEVAYSEFDGSRKFVQTLNAETYHKLERTARKRGSTIQQLVRAVVIPSWLDKTSQSEDHPEGENA
jgi:predicted transcriptional regulator